MTAYRRGVFLFVSESVDFLHAVGSAFGGAFQVVTVANAGLPWFRWWVRDALSDSRWQSMPAIVKGCYIQLLSYQWEDDGLPDDVLSLSRLCGLTEREAMAFAALDGLALESVQCLLDLGQVGLEEFFYTEIWRPWLEDLFPVGTDGKRRNIRLEKEKVERTKTRRAQSEHGKTGRRKQLSQNNKPGVARATPGHLTDADADEEKTSCGFVYPEAFEEFWLAYPPSRSGRKPGKRAALDAWKKIPKTERPLAAEAATAYAAAEGPRGFVKHAERFLAKDFWRDWLGAPEATPSTQDVERERLITDLTRRGWKTDQVKATKEGLDGARGVELWEQISTERLRKMSDASLAF